MMAKLVGIESIANWAAKTLTRSITRFLFRTRRIFDPEGEEFGIGIRDASHRLAVARDGCVVAELPWTLAAL